METRRSLPGWGFALGLTLLSLWLYARTTAPSVVALFDDSLEFQLVLPTLGIAHPTGYPLYTLLGYLFTRLPLGEPAYRANLFSAVAAAGAVGVLYLAARELTGRRLAAVLAAAQFATMPVWWSQATIAEVYALHGLLQASLLWLILRWAHGRGQLWPVGLAFGLGLAHHRMILLLAPAAVLWLASRRSAVRKITSWRPALIATGAPLLLYLYLPLRGRAITSLDGTYRNDWRGFWAWVTARQYSVFLAGNPFQVERDARFYLDLVRGQIQNWGIVLAVVGLLALIGGWVGWRGRRSRRDGLGLALALAATYGFGVSYKAADIEVFFIPALLCTSLAVAAGIAVLQAGWTRVADRFSRSTVWHPLGQAVLGVGLLFLILSPAWRHFPQMDRSQVWELHDLGKDILSQPLPQDAAIVGILGETTLVRYAQFAFGLRPDVQPVPADREEERFAAIERLLREGRPVFLTRPLPGAEARYSLGAVGPLIRVWPKGTGRWDPLPGRIDHPMGQGIRLQGYLTEVKRMRSGRVVRLTLHWRTDEPVAERLKVSARLTTPADDKLVARDDEPVHAAYPTTAWLPGEVVQDVYDLRVPDSVPEGTYEVLLILYRAADLQGIGRVSLGTVTLPAP